jgi:O-antigen/teichoic acid export membrane protein
MHMTLTVPIVGLNRIVSRLVLHAPEPGSVERRMLSGTVWSMAGSVISQGLGLLATIVTARLLGRNTFGEFGMVQGTAGMLGIFAGMGLGATAARYVSHLRNTAPVRINSFLLLSNLAALASGGTIAIALCAFAPFVSQRAINAPHLSPYLRVCSALLVINAISGAQTGALAGFEAFRALAKVNVLRGLAVLPITALLVYAWGLSGAVWSLVILAALGWVLNEQALRRLAIDYAPSSFQLAWAERAVLWHFSVPALFSSAMVGPVGWIASSILVNTPGGYAEMGIFNAANQWRAALVFIPNLLGQVTLPILAGSQEHRHQKPVIWSSIIANAVCVLPVVLILCLFSNSVMRSYGKEFDSRGPVLILSGIASALLAIQTPIASLIAASNKMWTGFFMNLGWAALLIISSSVLISNGYGADGLAAAYLLAYAAHVVWTFAYGRHLLNRVR